MIKKDDKGEAMDAMWGEQASPTNGKTRTEWFRHDKYSMFIHWGLYSLLGGRWKGKTYYGIGEWIMHPALAGIPVDDYRKLAAEFNPVDFDANAIVGLAKQAGMRCIVITAKHHEGFAMFDSAASDFTIAKATPFGRDVMAELAEACDKAGIRLGFYYSQFQDWIEPDGGGSMCKHPDGFEPDFDRYFEGKVIPQVTELLSNYGPISVVWFDTPGRMGPAYSQRLVDLVHDLQPGCLVNSRVGNGLGDYSTLGDMEIPTKTPDAGVFESIDTTNDSWSFSYQDTHWKSPSTIARSLVRVAARGCSFMLNIGPDGKGAVPTTAAEALSDSGRWLADHGEAVYGTAASPFPPFTWGDCTTKDTDLFVHVFDWPGSGQLKLAAIGGNLLQATLLKNQAEIAFKQQDDVVILELPHAPPDSMITVIRLRFDAVPTARHQALTVVGDYSTELLADYADLDGVRLETVRWMETFGEWKRMDTLAKWFEREGGSATWNLNVVDPGRYAVTVEYACEADAEGTEWEINCGSETMHFCTLDTGQNPDAFRRRQRFRTVECGVIQLTDQGRKDLSLSVKSNSGSGIVRMRRLILQPWK